MTDSPNQRLCMGCKEWIDARAAECYLCGEPAQERNVALINAVQTERLNSNLAQQASRARAEQRIARNMAGGTAGKTGPSKLYNVDGARQLAAHYKTQLQNAGFGEK